MRQIRPQEFAGGFRVGDDALSAPFGNLRPHAHQAVSWVKITALQRAEFFTAQPCVIRKGSHATRPKGRLLDYCQKGPPLLVAWNPGHCLEAGHERPFSVSPKGFARCIPAAANRVISSLPLLDEEIEEQPNGGQSLLKRGVG